MNKGLTIEKYRTMREIYERLIKYVGIPDDENKLFIPEGNRSNESIIERLCSSLQNSGQMSNSIRFNDRSDKSNRDKIKKAVCDFNAERFIKNYKSWQELYDVLTDYGKNDNGKNRRKSDYYFNDSSPKTNWEKYALGLYEGIHYLVDGKDNGFEKVKKLINLSGNIKKINSKEIQNIKEISSSIPGMGIALTCDWLKKCGCTWLVKPDTHIKEVYKHLIEPHENVITDEKIIIDMFDYAVLIREKEDESMTAYKLDKMIWLLCAGNFYQYDIKVGRDLLIKKI